MLDQCNWKYCKEREGWNFMKLIGIELECRRHCLCCMKILVSVGYRRVTNPVVIIRWIIRVMNGLGTLISIHTQVVGENSVR